MYRQLILASLGIFIGLVMPAYADLTSSEKLTIKKVYLAGVYLDDAAKQLGIMLADTNVGTNNVAALGLLWAQYEGSRGRIDIGLEYLLGSTASSHGELCTTCATTAFTAGQGTLAPIDITCSGCQLGTGAGQMQANFTTASSDMTKSAAYRAAATTAVTDITCARALVDSANADWDNSAAVDTSCSGTNLAKVYPVTFADPLPTSYGTSAAPRSAFGQSEHSPFIPGTSANAIGPHGDYLSIIGAVGSALGFQLKGLGSNGADVRQAYRYDTNGEAVYSTAEFTSFGNILIWSSQVATALRHYAVAQADVPVTDAECALTPFHLSARRLGLLIDKDSGLPFMFESMANASDGAGGTTFLTLLNAVMTRPVARYNLVGRANGDPSPSPSTIKGWSAITLETWRFSDGAAWLLLEFPINAVKTLKVLRSQFDSPVTTHDGTICPDSTAPSTTITSPTVPSTLAGMGTLTATASDNIGVQKVVFTIAGQTLGQAATIAPYTVRWDSKEVANGSRTITATVTDYAGNTATHNVAVTVSN